MNEINVECNSNCANWDKCKISEEDRGHKQDCIDLFDEVPPKEYIVEVYQVSVSRFTVNANTLQEAIDAYESGEGEFLEYDLEYCEDDTDSGYNAIRSVQERVEGSKEVRWEELKQMKERGELS